MPTGAARDDANIFEFTKLLLGKAHFAEIDLSAVLRNASEKSVAHGARLLKNFLLHVVLVAAFFRHDGIPGDVMRLALDGFAAVVHDADAVFGEHGDVAIGEKKHVARVFQQRGNIAGDKIFAFAEADNRGRSEARGNNFVRIAGGKKNQRVDSAQLLERFAYGLFERNFLAGALQIFLNEVGDDFGVGFGDEFVAFALQLFFKLQIIFDDAVVHDDDLSGAVAVRMRVFFRGTSVCGPPGVADAVGSPACASNTIDRGFLDDFFQVAQLAGGAANFQFAGRVHDGDTGGVIAAVFQFAQPFDNDRNDFFGADVAHDSAHAAALLVLRFRVCEYNFFISGLLRQARKPRNTSLSRSVTCESKR